MSEDMEPKGQIDRFREAARALECYEDEAAFDEKLKGIARQKLKKVAPQSDDEVSF